MQSTLQTLRFLRGSIDATNTVKQLPPRGRSLSTLASMFQTPTHEKESLRPALKHAMEMVQRYDPAGYLAGRLLGTNAMRVSYYAVRSFWVETGLRFETTALVPPHTSPEDHLQWWKQGIEQIYNDDSSTNDRYLKHPTLQLLETLQRDHDFTKCHFEDILKGRSLDLELKQYSDMKELEDHAEWSCGSLMQLILESDGIRQEEYPATHETAKLLGKSHGLANALRTSIPVMSTTGRLIIPTDLCVKYGVRTPRYLLSALGQGDTECIQALRMAVCDIAERSLSFLQEARDLRPRIEAEAGRVKTNHIYGVFLPGLASETFLTRLKEHHYDLTDRNLRNVSSLEHAYCSLRMIRASFMQEY